MTAVIDEIQFGRTRVPYEIIRSKRRETIGISVNPDTTVTVVAPAGVWRRQIREVVASRAAWVVEKQDVAGRHGPSRTRKLVSGEALPYLGRDYQLKVVHAAGWDGPADVHVERGRCYVTVGRGGTKEQTREAVRAALRSWYREHAHAWIAEVAERYGSRLGVTYKATQIYEMRTRWGSGGGSGRLRFNWRTIMAPRRLVEYVVAHELCHVRHSHHSPAFWRMLGSVMPDYEQRRLELAYLGPRLDL